LIFILVKELFMTTVEVPARLTIDDLLTAVDQLPNGELTQFVRRVLALQSHRGLSILDQEDERPLLDAIHYQRLNARDQTRLRRLRSKSQQGTLTPTEHAELLQFVQRVEQQDLVRVEALIQLAQKRGVTVPDLLQELGVEAQDA
jgi:hypothetical protein